MKESIGSVEVALGDATTTLNVNLLPFQQKGVHEYVKLYATTVATNLVAYVQVLCCCVMCENCEIADRVACTIAHVNCCTLLRLMCIAAAAADMWRMKTYNGVHADAGSGS